MKYLSLSKSNFPKLVFGSADVSGSTAGRDIVNKVDNSHYDGRYVAGAIVGLVTIFGLYKSYEYIQSDSEFTFFPTGVVDFVTRSNELYNLREKINIQNTSVKKVLITGTTGTGKSELAKSYARFYQNNWFDRNKSYYVKVPLIYWLNGKNPLDSYEYFAFSLGINLKVLRNAFTQNGDLLNYQVKLIKAVNQKLRQHPGWLLIWDNVESYSSIENFVPKINDISGTIIITSLNSDLLSKDMTINLNDGMSQGDAIKLLQKIIGLHEDEESILYLAKELYFLPLALMEAGIYIKHIRQSDINFSSKDYLIEYTNNSTYLQKPLDDSNFNDKKYSQLKAVELIIENILSKESILLLKFLSLINIQAIPKFLVILFLKETGVHGLDSEQKAQSMVDELCKNGLLIATDGKNESFTMHEVIKEYLHKVLKKDVSVETHAALVSSVDLFYNFLFDFTQEDNQQSKQMLENAFPFLLNIREILSKQKLFDSTQDQIAILEKLLICVEKYYKVFISQILNNSPGLKSNLENLVNSILSTYKNLGNTEERCLAIIREEIITYQTNSAHFSKENLSKSLELLRDNFKKNNNSVALVKFYKNINLDKAKNIEPLFFFGKLAAFLVEYSNTLSLSELCKIDYLLLAMDICEITNISVENIAIYMKAARDIIYVSRELNEPEMIDLFYSRISKNIDVSLVNKRIPSDLFIEMQQQLAHLAVLAAVSSMATGKFVVIKSYYESALSHYIDVIKFKDSKNDLLHNNGFVSLLDVIMSHLYEKGNQIIDMKDYQQAKDFYSYGLELCIRFKVKSEFISKFKGRLELCQNEFDTKHSAESFKYSL